MQIWEGGAQLPRTQAGAQLSGRHTQGSARTPQRTSCFREKRAKLGRQHQGGDLVTGSQQQGCSEEGREPQHAAARLARGYAYDQTARQQSVHEHHAVPP